MLPHWCNGPQLALSDRGAVKFTEPPKEVPWGVQAVFENLCGNAFALVGPR